MIDFVWENPSNIISLSQDKLESIKSFNNLNLSWEPCCPMTPLAVRSALYNVKQKGVQGDYLEFGISRGYTLAYAYEWGTHFDFRNDRRYFGFDSFQGLPDLTGIDATSGFTKGHFRASREYVDNAFNVCGVNKDKVILIEGWFEDTLKENLKDKLNLRKAAVVLIDSDLYISAIPVLFFIIELLQEGAMLLFDDWACFDCNPEKGEQKAFNEWLPILEKTRNLTCQWLWDFGWHGKTFRIVKK